jgi:hypothetical protein
LWLILCRVWQRPLVLEDLAEITAIDPAAAGRAWDEMLGLACRAFAKPRSEVLAARVGHGGFLERQLVGSRSVHALIVLAHVLSPSLDLLGLLLIHSRDFISGVTKRMQDFI